jgi:hypothetical protein
MEKPQGLKDWDFVKNQKHDISRLLDRNLNPKDYYYQCDGCGSYHCCGDCSSYEYLPDNEQPKPTDYVYRRGKIHVSRGSYISGKMIDMKTIYSKEILRQKKLDAIFGSDYTLYGTKTYLKDILNEKIRNILRKLD